MACSAWACAVTSGSTSEGWFYSGEVHVIGTLVFLFMHWGSEPNHGERKGECVSPDLYFNLLHKAARACRARSSRSPSLVIGRCCPLTCVEEDAPDCGSCVVATVREQVKPEPGMVVTPFVQQPSFFHVGSTKHESSGTPLPLAPRRRLGYTSRAALALSEWLILCPGGNKRFHTRAAARRGRRRQVQHHHTHQQDATRRGQRRHQLRRAERGATRRLPARGGAWRSTSRRH